MVLLLLALIHVLRHSIFMVFASLRPVRYSGIMSPRGGSLSDTTP
jgi:hypothetical protein